MATAHAPGFVALFLSAERDELTPEENRFATEYMAHRLRAAGLTFDRVVGQYQGKREHSFRVCLNKYSMALYMFERDVVMDLAHEFRQEAVLLVGAQGRCVMLNLQDGPTHVGQWSRLSDNEIDLGDWTLIGGEHFGITNFDYEVES